MYSRAVEIIIKFNAIWALFVPHSHQTNTIKRLSSPYILTTKKNHSTAIFAYNPKLQGLIFYWLWLHTSGSSSSFSSLYLSRVLTKYQQVDLVTWHKHQIIPVCSRLLSPTCHQLHILRSLSLPPVGPLFLMFHFQMFHLQQLLVHEGIVFSTRHDSKIRL